MCKGLRKVFILAIVCITLVSGVDVVMADVTIDNTGEEMKTGYYGDSKLASSFSNAKYVDCYVPYKLTPEDIGGYAVGASDSGNQVSTSKGGPMEDYARKSPISTVVNYEGDHDTIYSIAPGTKAANDADFPITIEEETQLEVLTDKNGNQYYLSAVQPWFYRHDKKGTYSDLSCYDSLFA